MSMLNELQPAIGRYEAGTSDERKKEVRELQSRVQAGEISLADPDFHRCQASEFGLGRILAYLLVQYGRVPVSSSLLRSGLLSEMERLERSNFEKAHSRMPLYYAARAYVERLKSDKSLLAGATDDLAFLRQVETKLARLKIDLQGQVLPKIQEAIELVSTARRESSPLTAAFVARRGVLVAAVIALIGALASAWIDAQSKVPPVTQGSSVSVPSSSAKPPD